MDNQNEEFNGVFMFTNPTDKERKYLWNNREYVFPPKSTVPLIIYNETLENVQEIRKRFAYRMAEERFYEGEVPPSGINYSKMLELGRANPSTFDQKILEPFIEECLKPLPIAPRKVIDGKPLDKDTNYKATKAMADGESPTNIFREDENRYTVGVQPDHA